MIAKKVKNAARVVGDLVSARVKYRAEATPETYKDKVVEHHHFSDEKSALEAGKFPPRVIEIREIVPGQRVLEAGCAEGIQSFALAQTKSHVHGFDISEYRVKQARELLDQFSGRGVEKNNVEFDSGAVEDFPTAFEEADTLLAARVIYHYRSTSALNRLLRMCSQHLDHVVLVGDRAKSRAFTRFRLPFNLNPVKFWFYAGHKGMETLLSSHGFSVALKTTSWGDPVAVGSKSNGVL